MIYIYILEREGVPFYVGKAKNTTRRRHSHYRTYDTNITLSIIDSCDDNRIIWKPLEEFWIRYLEFLGFSLLNKNYGGGGPTSYSEESKIKMRKPRPGSGVKISKTLIENNHSKYYTEGIRKKMSKNQKGSHCGPFTDTHLSNLKDGLRKNSKRVLQYDLNGKFIKEWKSKGEAVEWIITQETRAIGQNVPSQIKDCCVGRMISCWGYIWRFRDEFIPIVPKYYPIEQYKDGVLLEIFYNELEAENYILKNDLTKNKQRPRDLIKMSIKKDKTFCGFKWKYKYE